MFRVKSGMAGHEPGLPMKMRVTKVNKKSKGKSRRAKLLNECLASVRYHKNEAERWKGRGVIKRRRKLMPLKERRDELTPVERVGVSRRRASRLAAQRVKWHDARVRAESVMVTAEEKASLREGVASSPLRSMIQARKAG